MQSTSTDRIHKHVLLAAPRHRVWQAIADSTRFGQWFGVELDGPFSPGALVRGRILDQSYAHIPFEITIERMEPERLLSWRWQAHPVEPDVDYAHEPTTLVVFELEDQPTGTLLTIVESGFDALSPARRAEAYRGNDEGWSQQLQAIERYVGQTG
jgi:uncharacterized protein YndB with AHSA1/START domain